MVTNLALAVLVLAVLVLAVPGLAVLVEEVLVEEVLVILVIPATLLAANSARHRATASWSSVSVSWPVMGFLIALDRQRILYVCFFSHSSALQLPKFTGSTMYAHLMGLDTVSSLSLH